MLRRLTTAGGRIAQAARQVRELEGVPAEHIDVVPHKWREPGHLLVADVEAVLAKLGDCGVHIAGVEERESVEDEAEGPRRQRSRCPAVRRDAVTAQGGASHGWFSHR
ncbi:hypothetical protein F750_0196 [Streptomyces sp. PAMC 26508]|nr:hypothetical protein F750_0196 [Streptomyces sp. PAMC 26508]